MVRKITNEYIKGFTKALLHTDNSEIAKAIKKIEKMVDKNDMNYILENLFLCAMSNEIIRAVLAGSSDDEVNDLLATSLNEYVEVLPEMLSYLKLDIKLKGLEKYCTRTILIPFTCNLSQLAYLVLGAFHIGFRHQFTVRVKNEQYLSKGLCENEPYVMDSVILGQVGLNLQKGMKIHLTYDMGENYEFEIRVADIIREKHIVSSYDSRIIRAKGGCVWEDNHELMEYYYKDKEMFYKVLHEDELTEDDFEIFIDDILDSSSLLDYLNEDYLSFVAALHHFHEFGEELEDTYDDEMLDIF